MKIEINGVGSKAVWAVRLIWVVLALVVLGNLATMTEANAVSVSDKPLLSLASFAGLVVAYPVLKWVIAPDSSKTSTETTTSTSQPDQQKPSSTDTQTAGDGESLTASISGTDLWFLGRHHAISRRRLWAIRLLLTIGLLGSLSEAANSQDPSQSGPFYFMGTLVGIAILYWLALKIASVHDPEPIK